MEGIFCTCCNMGGYCYRFFTLIMIDCLSYTGKEFIGDEKIGFIFLKGREKEGDPMGL